MSDSSPVQSAHRGGTRLPAWDVDQLPDPPKMRWSLLALLGPGLMMAGAAIGGGEWLTGPRNTAKYGGALMWLAGASILLQVFYNLEVIRYATFCGESIFVGKFRMTPGPRFWTIVYLAIDFFGLWPYLSANAAVPLAAAFLGHVPAVLPIDYGQLDDARIAQYAKIMDLDEATLRAELAIVQDRRAERKPLQAAVGKAKKALKAKPTDPALAEAVATAQRALDAVKPHGLVDAETDKATPYPPGIAKWMRSDKLLITWLGIAIFMLAFVPLVFGGKIYQILEWIMTAKIFIVLAYLVFVGVFYVSRGAWAEAFGGFLFLSRDYNLDTGVFSDWHFRLFPVLPPGEKLDWALLGAFAAVAGQGGLNNAQFSSYARDKGWGMGAKVGAIPSLVGGRSLRLPHTGSCFVPDEKSLPRWKQWMRLIARDQWLIWFTGCILGMAIPSVISLDPQYRSDVLGIGDTASAAATAFALSTKHGQIFWFLTLLCGFLVLAPNQISTTDGLVRRWTEVVWTGNKWMQTLPASSVRYLYFGLLIAYAIWGVFVLAMIGDSGLGIVKVGSCIMNFALGFSALHTLVVNNTLLPKPVRPGIVNCLGLFACGLFFIAIAYVGGNQLLEDFGIVIGR